MKREYKSPVAKFVDYCYEEQVVAESSKFDGYGDGHKVDFCTYQSGAFSNPCSVVVNSTFPTSICNSQPWSLR